jgi:hypothetical protein
MGGTSARRDIQRAKVNARAALGLPALQDAAAVKLGRVDALKPHALAVQHHDGVAVERVASPASDPRARGAVRPRACLSGPSYGRSRP